MNLLEQAYDPETFRRQGHAVVDMLADYLADSFRPAPALPVIPWRRPEAQLQRWQEDLTTPSDADPLLFLQSVLEESIHLHQPRFMGHQVCPPAPLSALAGLLGGLLNNGMAVYEMGGPATAMERIVVETVARHLGFGPEADGVLTSGGTLANLTALLSARSRFADVWQDGHRHSMALMVSEEAHYCVDRAARIMGWGEQGIIKVPVDVQYRMRAEYLEPLYAEAQSKGIAIIAVVGSACSTSTGSFDDLAAIGAFCARHSLWFHVDGAHGAAPIFSTKYKHLLAGIETADSVALDFHKMLMTPALTTALVFRAGRDSYRTFSQHAQYLFSEQEPEWYNIAKRSFECTKLMMSVKVYILLRTYGVELFAEYVDRVIDNGKVFAALLQERPRWETAIAPQCNIVCFRYLPEGADEAETDAVNRRIRETLLEDGRFYIVQTTLKGRLWLRVTLVNPFTTAREMTELLECCEGWQHLGDVSL